VTGTLTYKGKPVPNVLVHFEPESGRPSTGRTDDKGHFKLEYDPKSSGAVRGKHKVYVTLPPGGPAPGQEDTRSAETKEMLAKYGPDSSKVEVTVEKDSKEVKLEWE